MEVIFEDSKYKKIKKPSKLKGAYKMLEKLDIAKTKKAGDVVLFFIFVIIFGLTIFILWDEYKSSSISPQNNIPTAETNYDV